MSGDAQRDAAAIFALTPGEVETPPYLDAGLHALKWGGKAVLSGGARGAAAIPYAYAVHKGLSVSGKWMCNQQTLNIIISMITQGLLKVGRSNGAVVSTFSLDDHEAAIENAEKAGG
jgi:D-arabinose 1-dehydrogenase-like Zn-dependent alcohol dehydrogenase